MVKTGYKQTEIGILPDTWDTITFENCFTILPNNTLSRAELNYNSGEVQNIHYGDILVKFPAVLDCSAEGLPYINAENTTKDSKGFLRDGDLIVADTAEDVIVGKSTEVIGIGERKIVSGLHTIPCRPKDAEMFAPGWLGYFINYSTYHDQLIPYITGIKVSSISKSAISGTVIAVPKKEEQTEITAALTDIDTLITNLEKLIAKKRGIKQGAMQELLTGKRRLPGFDEEWMDSSIGDICELVSGGTPSTSVAEYWDGDIPWCTPTDITSCNGKYLYKTADSITVLGLANSSATMLPEGALLLCTRATIGAVKITAIPICTNQGFKSLVVRDCADNEWLYYAIQMLKKEMVGQAIGSTFLEISRKALANIHIKLPSKEEQKAIAGILSDMDSEICELEQKYRKYCLIKQGMMSELLTGRIRLL